MKILALVVVIAITGCAHDQKLSEQPAQAASQIQRWVAVGTPLADARHIMEQHHFTCELKDDHLYCDGRVPTAYLVSRSSPIVYRSWQVALVIVDGKVSAVHASTTGLIGL